MTRNIAALLLVSTLALASPVLAGPQEGAASFSVNAGNLMFDKAERLDDGPVLGARLGYDMHRNLGIEASFGFADTRSNLSASKPQAYAYTYRTDLLYYPLPEYKLVPFLTVGGGLLNLNGSELWGNRTSLLLEYGAGIKYYLSDNLALRADARNLISFDNNRHSDLEFTGGISYYFNKCKKAAVKVVSAAESTPVAAERKPSATSQAQPASTAPIKEVAAPKKSEPAPVVSKAPADEINPVAPASAQIPKAAPSTPIVAPVVAPPVTAMTTASPMSSSAGAASASSACTSTAKMSRIVAVQNGFEILADSTLAVPRVITLSNPTRLALDIDCASNGIGSKTLAFNHGSVVRVRTGNYPEKLRVVFDFNQTLVPSYRVEKISNGLKVSINSSAKF
jgi:outer membrane beta-barrel protein